MRGRPDEPAAWAGGRVSTRAGQGRTGQGRARARRRFKQPAHPPTALCRGAVLPHGEKVDGWVPQQAQVHGTDVVCPCGEVGGEARLTQLGCQGCDPDRLGGRRCVAGNGNNDGGDADDIADGKPQQETATGNRNRKPQQESAAGKRSGPRQRAGVGRSSRRRAGRGRGRPEPTERNTAPRRTRPTLP